MPKKTKRAKIEAQKRRRASIEQAVSSMNEPRVAETVKGEFSFRLNTLYDSGKIGKWSKKSEESVFVQHEDFMRADFIKSFVLVVLIFSLEVVIYFAWFKNQT
jgi:hypothetical protein